MPSVEQHFVGRAPAVRAIYRRILAAARASGPCIEDPKKTSIHLARKTAFAGVATRNHALLLTLKSDRNIESPRIEKRERASANRWHLVVRLENPAEVDAEIKRWLKNAIALASGAVAP
jgi:hypothetical protein